MAKVKFYAKRSDSRKTSKLFSITRGKKDINITFSVDDNGKKDLFTYIIKPVSIPVPDNVPPVANFSLPSEAEVGQLIEFDGTGSDSDGTVVGYKWVANGAALIGLDTATTNSFIMPDLPKVDITLTVTDDKGATGSKTLSVTKKIPLPPPADPCPTGQHRDPATGLCVDDSLPPPPPSTSNVIYDSNVEGKWNNGISRIVKDTDGDTKANGKGIFTAASGSPEVHIDGKGTAILVTKPGFGRFYLCVNNFNAQLDFDFNIMDSSVDNMSIKGRSRHQAGGACENRFGGLGNATSTTETDFKIEVCHNVHESGYNKTLSPKLKVGEWYSKRYIYKNTPDNKGIHMEDWIDFKDGKGLVKVFERTETNPKPHYMDKAMFMKESWIWARLNGAGSIAFRNMKVTDLG